MACGEYCCPCFAQSALHYDLKQVLHGIIPRNNIISIQGMLFAYLLTAVWPPRHILVVGPFNLFCLVGALVEILLYAPGM